MSKMRLAQLAAAIVALASVSFAVFEFAHAASMKTARAAIVRRQGESAARIATLETQLPAAAKRAQAVETDNTLLADALQQAQNARAAKAAGGSTPLTREQVDERFKRAQALARGGDPAEELRELVACYEGFRQVGGTAAVSRVRSVISALAEFGARYPEAQAVLQEKRDALRRQVLAGPGGADALAEFSSVLHALKEEPALLDLYDAIPAGDKRRTALARYSFDQLIAARRYTDAAEGRSFALMSASFEVIAAGSLSRGLSSYAINTAGTNIEVLAGAGDLAHARNLIERLLVYDGSESTRALVRQHVERAGHPELLVAP